MKNHLIIGGGIVGLGTAWQLLKMRPGASVTLLEKEKTVGAHQSSHNSGVLHAGLYYKPGSQKAALAVAGIREMTAFCREFSIPHEICGKLVVATNEEELPRLRTLLERGNQNGLRGLAWLERDAMREIEPHAGGIAGVRVPEEGIVDYLRVCETLAREIGRMGGQVVTNARVTKLHKGWIAETTAGEYRGDFLINCAGLHCDLVSKLAGEHPSDRIVPFRGEYYKLRDDRASLVRHLIYPVPDPKFPFLGVHYTRMIHGGVECGPNAVLAFAREGYRKTDINPADLWNALAFPGLWRFLARHPRMCRDEWMRSMSRRLFCQSLQKLVPEIREDDLSPGGSGVRAQAITRDGELVQDFNLLLRPDALHVLNAPSPAATASLAIGRAIVQMIGH